MPAPVTAGLVIMTALLAVLVLMPPALREVGRERSFDLVLAADQLLRKPAKNAETPVVVVDIDRRALAAVGVWPWQRETVAQLIERIAAAKPAAIGIDILFADPDSQSPAALARNLATFTGRSDLATLAESLPDGDRRLAKAAEDVPIAFGFVLDPDRPGSVPGVQVLTRGSPMLDALWSVAGAVAPIPALAAVADGLGALSLPGDADALVRRVPLLVAVGNGINAGLALETVRLSRGASTYLIEAEPLRLATGNVAIRLSADGMLRLAPVAPDRRAAATVSAADVLAGNFPASALAGTIVLVGGSAPELGGLRATVRDPLIPSVQLHADAVRQILVGRHPRPMPRTMVVLIICGLGALAIVAGTAMPPLLGALAMCAAIAATWALALALSVLADRLHDPLTPSLVAAATFIVVSVTSFAHTRWREALVRRRFEQHLAPAVVDRIVRNPAALKLSGERREVTSLFTDVESFTAMTQRADPEQLVSVLDEYFEGLAAIVVAHGGMIDKIVGDAIHALFNAPLDLDEHSRQAVDCAIAIRAWAHPFRQRPMPAALGFGRTRVGVETGLVIVGDVGISAKLDYTAHGDAVNLTARLEAANKDLGSTICVGPVAAARCDPYLLRPLGVITVRGRSGPLAVFEPWPQDAPAAWCERYLRAFHLIESDRAGAIALFEQLGCERADDPVPRRMAERLRAEA
jgi:adenylate cyclase